MKSHDDYIKELRTQFRWANCTSCVSFVALGVGGMFLMATALVGHNRLSSFTHVLLGVAVVTLALILMLSSYALGELRIRLESEKETPTEGFDNWAEKFGIKVIIYPPYLEEKVVQESPRHMAKRFSYLEFEHYLEDCEVAVRHPHKVPGGLTFKRWMN